MRTLTVVVLTLLLSAPVQLVVAIDSAPALVTVIRAGRLIDVIAGRVLTNQSIIVRGTSQWHHASPPAHASPVRPVLTSSARRHDRYRHEFRQPRLPATSDLNS